MQYRKKIVVATITLSLGILAQAHAASIDPAHTPKTPLRTYEEKAAEARAEVERRSQITSSLYAKYPRPVDVARARADSFEAQAVLAAQKPAKHS